MRMIMLGQFPIEPFNSLVRSGQIGPTIHKILDAIKPEAAWFTERDGHRGCIFVVHLNDAADVARFAEPLFLGLNANVEYRIAMVPEDLANAGLDAIGKAWS
jgi:hypothetical protein